MKSKPLVVNYAILGYRPYREPGEFINVGVVAVEARSRFLAYRLVSPQRTRRVRACFPEVDLAVYKTGLRRIEEELSALAIETNLWADDVKHAGKIHPAQGDLFVEEGNMEFFLGLTADRSSTFFYSARGTRLAAEVGICLDELYRRYVEHWNLTPADYEEKNLLRDLRRLLHTKRLDRVYREAPWVGTDNYHVGIPLAYTPQGGEIPQKAIKPLNLAQSTPTRIYTHGDEWIAKVRRLQRVGCLPQSFLFVVKKPEDPEGREAAEEICDGLVQAGAEVLEVGDDDAILAFADFAEPEELVLTE